MRRVSLQWSLVWTLLLAVMSFSGAFSGTLTEVLAGPPQWIWSLDTAMSTGDTIIVQNSSGEPWTAPGTSWTTSQPVGWEFIGAESLLKWEVTGSIGEAGAFGARPEDGAQNDPDGDYGINGPPGGGGGLPTPVTPVPEASSLALMALGLCAGAIWKWRKK